MDIIKSHLLVLHFAINGNTKTGRAVYRQNTCNLSEKFATGIAWDIIAPKPEVGKKVSGARILPAYRASRAVRAVAA